MAEEDKTAGRGAEKAAKKTAAKKAPAKKAAPRKATVKKTAASAKAAAKEAAPAKAKAAAKTREAPKKATAKKPAVKKTAAEAPGKGTKKSPRREPKPRDPNKRYLTVEQIGSPIRRPREQRATLVGLGLNRMRRRRTLEDTPAVRGMIAKVGHLVRIVEEQ